MELWIRSQDKRALLNVRQVRINGLDIMCLNGELLGTYISKERALEVLDEIQKTLKSKKYLLKVKKEFDNKTIEDAKFYFEHKNDIDLIMNDNNFDIIPIGNDDIVIYEMPKE